MDYYAQIKINPYLNPDEDLIWAGQPQAGIKFRKSDILFIPFGMLWTAFFAVLIWQLHIYTTVPFFFVGLYMLIGRFIVDARYRTRVYYALTDSRIIILRGYFKRKIESVPLKELGEIKLSAGSDDSGTILLEPANLIYNWKSASYFHSATQFAPTRLEFLSDAKTVCDEISKAQKKAKLDNRST
jgi:hypothetical protein